MLALRGSDGVAREWLWLVLGSVHGRVHSFLLLFIVLGDTYPSIYYTKHSVASSNTVIYDKK